MKDNSSQFWQYQLEQFQLRHLRFIQFILNRSHIELLQYAQHQYMQPQLEQLRLSNQEFIQPMYNQLNVELPQYGQPQYIQSQPVQPQYNIEADLQSKANYTKDDKMFPELVDPKTEKAAILPNLDPWDNSNNVRGPKSLNPTSRTTFLEKVLPGIGEGKRGREENTIPNVELKSKRSRTNHAENVLGRRASEKKKRGISG